MRALPVGVASAAVAVVLGSFACSGEQVNQPDYVIGGANGTTTAGQSPGVGGSGTAGSTVSTSGQSSGGGGSGPSDGGSSMGGTTGGTTGGSTPTTGGTAPTTGGSGGSGGSGPITKGRFKMLAYVETRAYYHQGSINSGTQMLQEFAMQNDFEVVMSDGDDSPDPLYTDDPQITAADLAQFDMVFFLNPTGNIFANNAEREIFKTWLKEKKSFAGVHAATDTEHDNTWYEDLVGEIYDGHSDGTPSATANLEESAKNHPALAGLPSPWTRNEEWYRFTKGRVSGGLPGLSVLLRFGGPLVTNGPAIGQPLAWTRCWEGIRSFYSAVGHDTAAFKDANVKKHILGGLLWAARRLHAPNETCP